MHVVCAPAAAACVVAVTCATAQQRLVRHSPRAGSTRRRRSIPATTPVYEGDAPMKFDFLKDMRRGDRLTLSAYSMGAHSGTHVDAPMHFVATARRSTSVPLDPLIGPARVIEIRGRRAGDRRRRARRARMARRSARALPNEELDARVDDVVRRSIATSPTSRPTRRSCSPTPDVQLVGIDYISAEQFGAPAPRDAPDPARQGNSDRRGIAAHRRARPATTT